LRAVCCEHGNETLSFLKNRGFLNQLSDYRILNKLYTVETVVHYKDRCELCEKLSHVNYLGSLSSHFTLPY
jgi:hypothetical protein